MNNLKNLKFQSFKTVFSFELSGFLKNKKNWVLVYIMVALSIILALSPLLINFFNDDSVDKIYLYFENTNQTLENTDSEYYHVIKDKNELNELLENDISEFYLINDENITLYTLDNYSIMSQPSTKRFSSIISPIYINSFMASNDLLEEYQSLNSYVNNIDIKPIQLTNTGYKVVENTNTVSDEAELGIRYILGYILVMIFYISMMQFGGYASSSVANEKASRTMESLIYSTNTNSLIYGKVFGIFIGSIIQILAIILLLLCGAFIAVQLIISGNIMDQTTINIIVNTLLGVINFNFILIFIILYSLGFLMTLFIFASLSATITKIEELPSAISIGTFISIITFLIGLSGLINPSSKLFTILAYVPFFTPLAMFSRFVMGATTTFDIMYAIISSIITVVLISLFAAKLYKVAVLLYGTQPTKKQLVKEIFKKNK